ncbi:MAG: energy-coupling factor transporter transmembrane component T [Thermofilum sp.]
MAETTVSVLSRINPSLKLILLLAGIFHLAFFLHPVVVLGHLLTASLLVLLGRVRVRRGFALGAATTIAGFTWVNYLLFVTNLNLSPVEALNRVALLSSRILVIILYSAFFAGTTDPGQLAASLTLQLRVPYVYSFMSFVTLRAAPIVMQDLDSMVSFRKVKGYISRRSPHRYLVSLVMPLLYLAVRRSTTLAISMEARGFGKYPSRTFMNPTKISTLDKAFAAAYLSALILISFLAVQLGGIAPSL